MSLVSVGFLVFVALVAVGEIRNLRPTSEEVKRFKFHRCMDSEMPVETRAGDSVVHFTDPRKAKTYCGKNVRPSERPASGYCTACRDRAKDTWERLTEKHEDRNARRRLR